MSFFDDVARNIGNFFGANNKPKAAPAPRGGSPAPRQTISAPSNTLRGAATAGVTLPQFDNTAAIAAQQEEERRRREAEELARRQAEEKRRAEEARKAEIARMAAQAVRDTNQQLGRDYQTIGGEELKAMQREATRGGDANLDAIKKYREQIIQRKQQQVAPKNPGPQAMPGVPQAVAGTLEQKRQQVYTLQQAVANGQAEDWQVRNATTDFYNAKVNADKIARTQQYIATNPQDFIGVYNKMTDAQQRKVRQDLQETAANYQMAGANPELASLGQQAAKQLALLTATPEQRKKFGLPEAKNKQSVAGVVEDTAKTLGMAPASLLSRLGVTGNNLLGGNPQKDLEDAYKRGELTQEEFIRQSNQLNQALSGVTGSLDGKDKGLLDRTLRAAGTAAEAASYIVSPGTAFTKGTAGQVVTKNLLADTLTGGVSAYGSQGIDTQWQDALMGAGFGAGGSLLGLASALPHLSSMTPDEFLKLPRDSQAHLIDQAEKAVRRDTPTPPAQQIPDEQLPFDELAAAPKKSDITSEYTPAPIADTSMLEPQVTPHAMNALAAGGKAAAYNILRSSGYKFPQNVENVVAEELARAKNPLEVKAILEKYSIKSETPQEAYQRLQAQQAEVEAAQAQQLAEAPQEVAAPVETPAPETATPKMENSADIAQNSSPFKDVVDESKGYTYHASDVSPDIIMDEGLTKGGGNFGPGVYMSDAKNRSKVQGYGNYLYEIDPKGLKTDGDATEIVARDGVTPDRIRLAPETLMSSSSQIAKEIEGKVSKELFDHLNTRGMESRLTLSQVDELLPVLKDVDTPYAKSEYRDLKQWREDYDKHGSTARPREAPKPEAPKTEKRTFYHGTKSKFDRFDDTKINQHETDAPYGGHWMSSDIEVAKGWGPNVHEAEVDTSKFLKYKDKNRVLNELEAENPGILDTEVDQVNAALKAKGYTGVEHAPSTDFGSLKSKFEKNGEVEFYKGKLVDEGKDGVGFYDKDGEYVTGYEDYNDAARQLKEGTFVLFNGQEVRPYQSPEAPAPKTNPKPVATEVKTTEKPISKPKTTNSDTPPAVNPALKMTEAGNIRPVGKGKGADNTQAIQRDLIKEADQLPKRLVDPIRTVENLARKLELASPRLGKHFEDFRQRASSGMAETIKRSDENTTLIAKAFKGQNKDQRQMTKYLVEHMSNKTLMKKYAKANPTEYKAAAELTTWIKAQLPEMNAILKENGLKEIGKIEDYFPRMVEMNTKKNSLSDILDTSLNPNLGRGEANVTKGFMKKRENAADLSELDPMDAMLVYGRQTAQVLHLAPVVQRGKAITKAIEAVEEVPEAARNELATLFRQVTNQVAGTGTSPETFAQRAAAKVRNITSKSQIAGSVNSVYAQIANPTAVMVRMFSEKGLWNGGRDTLALAANMTKTIGKNIDALETIDGMKSDYLVTARGAKNIQRNDAKGLYHKSIDAGYRFSNLGDLQSKNAAVRTLYDTNVRNGMEKKAALRKAERDAKDAIGDRTMGERSQFTASNKALNVLASQYQIEQIANVTSIMDGVLFNPRISHWKKFVGSMAALGGAYGANQATGALTGGQVQPLPDLLGAGIDAYNEVMQDNEERQKNGDKAMTPEEMAGLWLTHTGAAFISNLPFGRTVMSGVSAGVNKLGEGLGNDNLAADLGLNPRDTNPMQTLPAIGTVTRLAETAGDVLSGKKSLGQGAADVASKTLPYGGQAKKTIEGGVTFAQGGSSFPDSKNKDGTVEKGDKQFSVDNSLNKPSSFLTLFSMLTSGKYASKNAQEYINSGFDTQAERDIKKGDITADKVPGLTDEQYDAYASDAKKRFTTTLSDKEKKLSTLMGNSTLLNRNLGNGKVTQDEIDALKVKKNKYMYDKGLIDQIETGFKKEELDSLTPTLRAWVYDKAIQGRKGYKEKATTDASTAVINEALKNEEAWPGIDLGSVKATNELADKYLSYKMDSAKKQDDQAEQFDLRKKFWGQVVRQKYDKDVPGAYVGPGDTTTNPRDSYGLSVGNIEKMWTDDGLKVGSKVYKLNGADVQAMIALDDELMKAGLIEKPKFSDKFRFKYGIHGAPLADDGTETGDHEANTGYYDADGKWHTGKGKGGRRSGGGGGGGGGKTGPQSDANPTDYLLKTGTGSKGFAIKQAGGADSAPAMNLSQYRNKGAKSGKSSIKIKL